MPIAPEMIGPGGVIRRPPGVVAYADTARYRCGFGVPSDRSPTTTYVVCFDTAVDCWVCDCVGNIHHGHCKHLRRYGLPSYTERWGKPKGQLARQGRPRTRARAGVNAPISREDRPGDARALGATPTAPVRPLAPQAGPRTPVAALQFEPTPRGARELALPVGGTFTRRLAADDEEV